MFAIILCLLARLDPATPPRSPVAITRLDAENLLVVAREPISLVFIEDLYQNTDYFLEEEVANRKVRIRMLTATNPLNVVVETERTGTRGLSRRHHLTVPNPAKR
jgi:hypothetical protein